MRVMRTSTIFYRAICLFVIIIVIMKEKKVNIAAQRMQYANRMINLCVSSRVDAVFQRGIFIY